MITVYIKGRRYRTNVMASYNEVTNETIVKKGSVVSEEVKEFIHKESIEELRKDNVDSSGILIKNIRFSNPTSAAQFVCGYSVSGLSAWHVERHKNLGLWLKENSKG